MLEPRSVGAERLHYPLALGQLALRVDVGLDRAVVEERDKQKRADRKPTAQNDRPRATDFASGGADPFLDVESASRVRPGDLPVGFGLDQASPPVGALVPGLDWRWT